MRKKILSLSTTLSLFLATAHPSYADQAVNPCPDSAGGQFGKLCKYNLGTVADIIKNGITLLFLVATIASLLFLIFGGIKWISSGGDKTKLEEARGMIVASAVGLVITFASYFILNIILELFGLPSIRTYTIPKLIG